MQKISLVIPAHNEEKYIGRCLASVKAAAAHIDTPVETIVVLNRCTDSTADIARRFDAAIVKENARNLAKIRNAGVRAAGGDAIVTIDADSWMSANMLTEVRRHLTAGKYIGGGVRIRPERLSAGILFSLMMVAPYILLARVSAGMFWLTRTAFDAVGGFDEQLVSAEDYHFAVKLKQYGRAHGFKYGTIRRAHIVTSCRKFDRFGDWYLFKNPRLVREILKGHNQQAADHFYYNPRR